MKTLARSAQSALELTDRIFLARGSRVLLDADLAKLYGVPTHRLNEAVKRNVERFPVDFAFRLEATEAAALISQIAISKNGRGGRRTPPWVFTEHGALMAANVLNNARAVHMSVYVVRAFVRLRDLAAASPAFAKKLADVEIALASLDRETRERFQEVYRAIRALTDQPERKTRQIGFATPSK
jgi:ORF6N domain